MKTILLDTNFLLIPGQFNVDIFAEIERICGFEYELAVPTAVVDELKKLIRTGRGIEKASAKLGLQLVENKNVTIKPSQKVFKGADDFLLEEAVKKGYVVATSDKGLKRRLRESHVTVITLRQRQYLMIIK